MPTLVTVDEARAHCKADSADDAVLTMCLNAAEKACAQLANRTIYASQGDYDDALAGVPAALAAANLAYEEAVAAADEVSVSAEDSLDQIRLAKSALWRVRGEQDAIVNGIVVQSDIKAAILLMTGHLYRNREEVEVGQNAAATQIPMGARALMDMYRHLGSL